ncbi:LuxR C-terminal-related transcriptional regulator [Micromonospora sp. NPDC051141]|uniref:LuxR C-terminal-related transcriptional regulator n=1 Tax=Micromonospora sp. NPDC051141 TaxID=3364284 RepID=UPI0037A5FC4E
MTISVIVCAERAVVREGLRTMLAESSRVSVSGIAADLHSGMNSWVATGSDLVIADLALGCGEMVEAIRPLRTDDTTRLPIIVVCHDKHPATTSALLESGVSGVIAGDADSEEIVRAAEAGAKGDLYLAPSLAGELIDWLRAQTSGVDRSLQPWTESLTPREREVLVALAHGKSLDDTARSLYISMSTVRTHIYRIRHKVHARDRAELVSFAFRAGIV